MSEQMSNSARARNAFRQKDERERQEHDAALVMGPRQESYRYPWQELVRIGFWLAVGALIVFPVIMFLLGVVAIFVFGALGSG